MTAVYGGLSLGCMVAYWLLGSLWSDSVLLLFAAVIFSVHAGAGRVIQHIDSKNGASHGRRAANVQPRRWYQFHRP